MNIKRQKHLKKFAMVIVLSVVISYSVIFCFALLLEEVYRLNNIGNDEINKTTVLGKLGVLIPLGASSIIAASVIRIIFPIYGKIGMFTSAVTSIILITVDSQHEFFLVGLAPSLPWILVTIFITAVGAFIGYLIAWRQGFKYLWIPLAELLIAWVSIYSVFRLF